MDNGLLITVLSIGLPLAGAGVGYLVRYNVEKKRELLSEVYSQRRVLYQQFVDLIVDIFAQSKTENGVAESNVVMQLHSFYKKYILYASPQVITSFADFFHCLRDDRYHGVPESKRLEIQLKKMTKVMRCMRKDLGLSNKDLGTDGQVLIRAIITDYDSIMAGK